MTPIVTIDGKTITAPPGVVAYVDDGRLGWWATDPDDALAAAAHGAVDVAWVSAPLLWP